MDKDFVSGLAAKAAATKRRIAEEASELRVTLPVSLIERLEELAAERGESLDTVAFHALLGVLPPVRERSEDKLEAKLRRIVEATCDRVEDWMWPGAVLGTVSAVASGVVGKWVDPTVGNWLLVGVFPFVAFILVLPLLFIVTGVFHLIEKHDDRPYVTTAKVVGYMWLLPISVVVMGKVL